MLRILVVFFIFLSSEMNANPKNFDLQDSKDNEKSAQYKALFVLTNALTDDFICKNKKNDYICSAENVEILNGVTITKSTYKLSQKRNVLTITKSHKLDSINFIFEGYNLSKLFPQNVECVQIVRLFGDALLGSEHCSLSSNIYSMNFRVEYKSFYPPFESVASTMDALNAVYSGLLNDENFTSNYQYELQLASINLQSVSLNDVFFDLYKREQRIANGEDSQNDKDYLTKNDDVLFADYKAFLQGYHDIFRTLRTDSTPSNDSVTQNNVESSLDSNKLQNLDSKKEKNLDALLDALIQIATTKNTTLQVKITNPQQKRLPRHDDDYLAYMYDIIDNMHFATKVINN